MRGVLLLTEIAGCDFMWVPIEKLAITEMTYSEKLRDPRWQKKRLYILERDNFRCVLCGDDKKNLQVHHVVYRKLDPWEYPNYCYQTLCVDCHKERQELTEKIVDALRLAVARVSNPVLVSAAQKLCAAAMLEIEVEL